jgi:hypothetical protein
VPREKRGAKARAHASILGSSRPCSPSPPTASQLRSLQAPSPHRGHPARPRSVLLAPPRTHLHLPLGPPSRTSAWACSPPSQSHSRTFTPALSQLSSAQTTYRKPTPGWVLSVTLGRGDLGQSRGRSGWRRKAVQALGAALGLLPQQKPLSDVRLSDSEVTNISETTCQSPQWRRLGVLSKCTNGATVWSCLSGPSSRLSASPPHPRSITSHPSAGSGERAGWRPRGQGSPDHFCMTIDGREGARRGGRTAAVSVFSPW